MNSVAEALEENGKDGEAYRSLVDLHDSLDDVHDFYQGVIDYTDAVGKASDGAGDLMDGAQELYDGMGELKDGLDELNDKLVDKLLDFLDGDLNEIKDRLKAVVDMARDYNSYAGIADGMSGSVHFLIRTAGI